MIPVITNIAKLSVSLSVIFVEFILMYIFTIIDIIVITMMQKNSIRAKPILPCPEPVICLKARLERSTKIKGEHSPRNIDNGHEIN
jgi:hypothetical protein